MESDFDLMHRIAEWLINNVNRGDWDGDLREDISRLLDAAEDVADYQDMRNS